MESKRDSYEKSLLENFINSDTNYIALLFHLLGSCRFSFFFGDELVGLFVLGILFGVIYHKTKSIWTSAILHSVWDALGFLI